jgi:hypothetical protein
MEAPSRAHGAKRNSVKSNVIAPIISIFKKVRAATQDKVKLSELEFKQWNPATYSRSAQSLIKSAGPQQE